MRIRRHFGWSATTKRSTPETCRSPGWRGPGWPGRCTTLGGGSCCGWRQLPVKQEPTEVLCERTAGITVVHDGRTSTMDARDLADLPFAATLTPHRGALAAEADYDGVHFDQLSFD